MRATSVELATLDDLEGPFFFRYDQYKPDIVGNLSIPGHGGGRDGPTIPDRPEQEAWMRAHSGLREVWYLTWEVPCGAELRRVLARMGAPGAFRWY